MYFVVVELLVCRFVVIILFRDFCNVRFIIVLLLGFFLIFKIIYCINWFFLNVDVGLFFYLLLR